VVQNDVKRMLAYSSIAHAGYILIRFAAAAVADGGHPPGTAIGAVLSARVRS
jgi:NADH:ubiquinone oxidoreductase subunit 2 (subunit N)